MPVPQSIFDEIYRIHGHRCPMSTLGGRLGYAARRHFAGFRPGEMAAIYRARTCAVDGIAHTTGCSRESGSLKVVEEGRHSLTLVHTGSGAGVEVSLLPSALEVAGSYRRLRLGLDRLAAEEVELIEAELDSILADLRSRPDDRLLRLEPVLVDPEIFLSEAVDA